MTNTTKKSKVYFYQIVPLVEKRQVDKTNKLFSAAFKFKNLSYKTIPFSDGEATIRHAFCEISFSSIIFDKTIMNYGN